MKWVMTFIFLKSLSYEKGENLELSKIVIVGSKNNEDSSKDYILIFLKYRSIHWIVLIVSIH